MNKTWHEDDNICNNWYNSRHGDEKIDIPRCISCDSYIVQEKKTSDVCSKCNDYVSKRISNKYQDFIQSFEDEDIFFEVDHIPEFSVITVFVDNESFITIGVDWGEVLITDVIEEDVKKPVLHKGLTKNEVKKNLIDFVLKVGDLMYCDMFDSDALRAMDVNFNNLIKEILNNRSGNICAWSSVDVETLNNWLDLGFIPKGEVFSLPKYFSFERKNSQIKDEKLVKICVDEDLVVVNGSNSVDIKEKIFFDDYNFLVICSDL